jgi:hypothetical protein
MDPGRQAAFSAQRQKFQGFLTAFAVQVHEESWSECMDLLQKELGDEARTVSETRYQTTAIMKQFCFIMIIVSSSTSGASFHAIEANY